MDLWSSCRAASRYDGCLQQNFLTFRNKGVLDGSRKLATKSSGTKVKSWMRQMFLFFQIVRDAENPDVLWISLNLVAPHQSFFYILLIRGIPFSAFLQIVQTQVLRTYIYIYINHITFCCRHARSSSGVMPDLSSDILLNFDTGTTEHTARRQLLADGPRTWRVRLCSL